MSELKPCPFCGGKVGIKDWTCGYESGTTVQCAECGASVNDGVENGDGWHDRAITAWNRRAHPSNEPLTLDELREMDGEPVWIQVLDRPDLSRWHFIVRHPKMGLIAKDGLGQYECYPHNSDQMVFSGCYYDIQHGHNYGVNWLAYRRKPAEVTP